MKTETQPRTDTTGLGKQQKGSKGQTNQIKNHKKPTLYRWLKSNRSNNPLEPKYLFFKPPEEERKLDDINFIPRAPTASHDSYFFDYIIRASNMTQVKQAYTHIYQTITKSDNVMTAYNVTLSDGKWLTGASSDKEYGARQAICQVLESKGLNSAEVFVRRRYRGSHLGSKKFQVIN